MSEPEQLIQELHASALKALESATKLDALEAVRIEALGRKGKLAEVSKGFGKLTPEERARVGKLLNSVKQELEASLETRKSAIESVALDARLESEWFDLTTPAPGVRPAVCIPLPRCSVSWKTCSFRSASP